MKKDASLLADITRLEQRLASKSTVKTAAKEITAKDVLAEIDELEDEIEASAADDDEPIDAADDGDDDEDDGDEPVAADAEPAMDDGEDAEVTSSEQAPGVEDEITQDKFNQVESVRHGDELTSAPSMHDVTGYTARLKEASVRLDRVAEYLESNGKTQLAFRIDKIADAVDKQLQATIKEAKGKVAMQKRTRITHRKAADGSIPYPGNVNQPGRTNPPWEQYHTFEQTVNHELPDMRHEWKDEQTPAGRDEIGFGVPEYAKGSGSSEAPIEAPKSATARIAANKAVKIAVLLLGEKVPEKVIEAQAKDFIRLGDEVMDRTLARFAKTQELYAADEEPKGVADEPQVGSAALAQKNSQVPPAIQTPADPQVVDKTAAAPVTTPTTPTTAAAAPEVPAKDAPADKPVEAKSKKAADEEPFIPVEDDSKKAGMDIELNGAADDELAPDPEADAKLAKLFEADGVPADDEQEVVEAKAKTAKKAGITRLGGQPKVAAEGGEATMNLSDLWATAPDVTEAFK